MFLISDVSGLDVLDQDISDPDVTHTENLPLNVSRSNVSHLETLHSSNLDFLHSVVS